MDGLEDQAEAGVRANLSLLYTRENVQIKHSSRVSIIARLCDALANPLRPLVVKKLALRSGISLEGIRLLQDTLLLVNSGKGHVIDKLEFVCLQDTSTLQAAILCCRRCGVTRLSLKNYSTRVLRQSRDSISETIRSSLVMEDSMEEQGADVDDDQAVEQGRRRPPYVKVEYLEIALSLIHI